MTRKDIATKVIAASPKEIFAAFSRPEAFIAWLPPADMTGHVTTYHFQKNGAFEITLTYNNNDAVGKTSDHTDVTSGTFAEIVPYEKIVQLVHFESDDPTFSGEMKMTWTLLAKDDNTEVTVVCENVPEGIKQADHEVGLKSTLDNLERYVS